MEEFAPAVVLYAVALVALAIGNRLAFRRSPEKGARYKTLPLPYKLACWFGVLPLLAAAPLLPARFAGANYGIRALCFVGGIAAFMLFRWRSEWLADFSTLSPPPHPWLR
jgi:hypothetical protein